MVDLSQTIEHLLFDLLRIVGCGPRPKPLGYTSFFSPMIPTRIEYAHKKKTGIYNIANLGGGGNKTSSYTLRVGRRSLLRNTSTDGRKI
ncbi:hypothetical protein OUZ56_002951 [Daphnia magna]|uniref:Uncharacterized protein n=1 Tax=Daphnia magna TaxID=35525 RepID=A0ABR0A7A0_9CRUS|nr:hypothetical protein OUZ56_002951 [Daphnia magna]